MCVRARISTQRVLPSPAPLSPLAIRMEMPRKPAFWNSTLMRSMYLEKSHQNSGLRERRGDINSGWRERRKNIFAYSRERESSSSPYETEKRYGTSVVFPTSIIHCKKGSWPSCRPAIPAHNVTLFHCGNRVARTPKPGGNVGAEAHDVPVTTNDYCYNAAAENRKLVMMQRMPVKWFFRERKQRQK